MVVLPFKASEEENMEELFTRRPIVQMVDTSSGFGEKLKDDEDDFKGEKTIFVCFKYSSLPMTLASLIN